MRKIIFVLVLFISFSSMLSIAACDGTTQAERDQKASQAEKKQRQEKLEEYLTTDGKKGIKHDPF